MDSISVKIISCDIVDFFFGFVIGCVVVCLCFGVV